MSDSQAISVLIIDDEPLVRRSLERLFRARGCTVEAADQGLIGWSLWQKKRFDIIFVDVLMPGLTGPQILQQWRNSPHFDASSRIILMSAYTGEYDLKAALDLGAHLFVSKPFRDIFAVADEVLALCNRASAAGPTASEARAKPGAADGVST